MATNRQVELAAELASAASFDLDALFGLEDEQVRASFSQRPAGAARAQREICCQCLRRPSIRQQLRPKTTPSSRSKMARCAFLPLTCSASGSRRCHA
jgi:hypothetical protein